MLNRALLEQAYLATRTYNGQRYAPGSSYMDVTTGQRVDAYAAQQAEFDAAEKVTQSLIDGSYLGWDAEAAQWVRSVREAFASWTSSAPAGTLTLYQADPETKEIMALADKIANGLFQQDLDLKTAQYYADLYAAANPAPAPTVQAAAPAPQEAPMPAPGVARNTLLPVDSPVTQAAPAAAALPPAPAPVPAPVPVGASTPAAPVVKVPSAAEREYHAAYLQALNRAAVSGGSSPFQAGAQVGSVDYSKGIPSADDPEAPRPVSAPAAAPAAPPWLVPALAAAAVLFFLGMRPNHA